MVEYDISERIATQNDRKENRSWSLNPTPTSIAARQGHVTRLCCVVCEQK